MIPSKDPFRVAVIGGGIGGLFAALFIHHHCKDRSVVINLYEQASEFKEIGAGIGLGVNAARLFHKIGIGEQLNSIAGDRNGIWFSFRRFDNGEGDSHSTGQDKGHDVKIHFADSTNATADLVVACDGIHSNIRNQFVEDKPVYSGQIAYRALVPISKLGDWPFSSYSITWCAKGKHMLVFPISQTETLNVVGFVTTHEKNAQDTKESWTSMCERLDVEKDFAEFDATVQKIVSRMPEQPSKWRINDREPLDQWHHFGGKVVMLGDAAHAMLPHLGAGAGQAIEDGWVLGRTLCDFLNPTVASNNKLNNLEAVANHYQSVRKPRAQEVQRSSREAGKTYEMQAEDMLDKSYEDCLPLMAERTAKRMKFVWEEDLDEAYDNAMDAPAESVN